MADLPGGTITFLFTDIEGSTRIWEQYPDPMRVALARHDVLMRAAIESHRGYVFKTVGDAFCAAFATASDALHAAVEAQQALLAESWPQETPLRVRMALHTGVAQQRDDDYFGPTLNRIARLLAIGHGGQTLLSLPTVELVRDALPAGVQLKDLGAHRIKDLSHAEQVYQLLHAGLLSDFAPLRSLDTRATNLPLQTSSFIGRVKEIEEIKRLLESKRHLTLVGPGGCGKTRLALQVAADLLDVYPDGIWLADLSALSTPDLVGQMVASALSVSEEAGRPLQPVLIDALKTRKLLLVLDNCEHVLEACARLVEPLLRACADLYLLATSREALGIAGEAIYRVPTLSLPEAGRTPSVSDLLQYEATSLFIERAGYKQPEFAITAQNARPVAQICRRLDGIPLAIELAAARLGSLSVEQIARFDDYFRLLTRGSRTAPTRQQTLQAAIDWSYDLLTESERILLARLSVFAGGCTLEAAEQVCAFTSPPDPFVRRGGDSDVEAQQALLLQPPDGENLEAWEVLDLLTSLVDKSLISYEEQEGRGRYRMLETVRQYAANRLTALGEMEAMRERHLDAFLHLSEEAEPQLTGPGQALWLDRLEREHDNLRAALTRAKEDEKRLRVVAALWRFWYMHGYLREGRSWLESALFGTGAVSPAVRARALNGAGVLAWSQGDHSSARTVLEEALALHRQAGNEKGMAGVLNNLASVLRSQGDDAAARATYAESLEIRRKLNDRSGMAASLNNLGIVSRDQGDYATARAYYDESLALYRELGDSDGAATALLNLGVVAIEEGDYARGMACYEESLTIRRQLGNKLQTAILLYNMADTASELEDMNTALKLFAECFALSQELSQPESIVKIFVRLAGIARDQQQYKRAARLLGSGEAIRVATDVFMDRSLREYYEEEKREIVSALGEDAFQRFWAEGCAMTLEEAGDYALKNWFDTSF